MPFYNDLNYHYGVNSLSYSPYYSSNTYSPFAGYSRALSGTYNAPPRTAYTSTLNRHYKPKLKPISETPFHTAIRSQALTALTRINSPKAIIPPCSKYIPPRPILINTANIDVSSSRFEKNHGARGRSISPEPVAYDETTDLESSAVVLATASTNEERPNNVGDNAFMPRIDQHDPPQFRSTIKRNRNIVRLSTVRSRSKSSSKNDSLKRKSSNSTSSEERSNKNDSSGIGVETVPEVKKSWRDRFGDSLQMPQKDVVRKTPGELILEKHIIRDTRKDKQIELKTTKTTVEATPPETFDVPEIIVPSEFTHTDAQRRKSIRRQSLAKCPSFKDICNQISSDIRKNDDLNAGELRRRASLILEQEQQILAQLSTSRRPSAELVNVDVPIIEADEENELQKKEVLLAKRKSKKKSVKKRPKFTVTVDVENGIVPLMGATESIEINTPTSPKSPTWKAIVEDVAVEHTVNKVIKLPKKKLIANIDDSAPSPIAKINKIKKSESSEDFWGAIGRRESDYFKKPAVNLATGEPPASMPTAVRLHEHDDKFEIELKSNVTNDAVADVDGAESATRRNSVSIVKSNSETDLPRPVKTKLKPPRKTTEASDGKKAASKQTGLSSKLPIIHETQLSKPMKPAILSKMQINPLNAIISQKEPEVESATTKVPKRKGTPPQKSKIVGEKDSAEKHTSDMAAAASTASAASTVTTVTVVDVHQPDEKQKAYTETSSVMQTDDLKITTGPLAKLPEQKPKHLEIKQVSVVTATDAVGTGEGNSNASANADANNNKGVNAYAIATNVSSHSNQISSALANTEITTAAAAVTPNSIHQNDFRADGATSVPAKTTTKTKTATTAANKVQGKVDRVLDAVAEKLSNKLADDMTIKARKSLAKKAATATTADATNQIAFDGECDGGGKGATTAATATIASAAKTATVTPAAATARSNNESNKSEIEKYGSTSLSKFATVDNLSDDLSFIVDKSKNIDINDTESCISGEETFDLLLTDSDDDYSDSDQYSVSGDEEENGEMGLKRRHRKKRDKFDPKRMVKLDHARKCYVVEETPKYPLIATPRPLQKKYHYYSESDTDSDETESGSGSSDEFYQEYLSPNDGIIKDVIRMSTCSNDSGFEGGGTAPASPKKMLGKHFELYRVGCSSH